MDDNKALETRQRHPTTMSINKFNSGQHCLGEYYGFAIERHLQILKYQLTRGFGCLQKILLHGCIMINAEECASHQGWPGNNLFWSQSTQGSVHRMNMGDKKNLVNDNIVIFCMDWEEFVQKKLSLQWRVSYCKTAVASIQDDLTIPWRLMLTYAEEIWFNWWKTPWLIGNIRWGQYLASLQWLLAEHTQIKELLLK